MTKPVRRLENRGRTDDGIISTISNAYEDFNNHWGSTVYDAVNAGLYLAAPFTGGATLVPAMAMTGLQAGAASVNAYDKGINLSNGLDMASAIPGFGLTEKAVKGAMKPVMKSVGKSTKYVRHATKYVPKSEKILVTSPNGMTFNFGKNSPTYWQMAMNDKRYAPYAALVYGEDAVNNGLNVWQVAKDIQDSNRQQEKDGGSIHIKPSKRGTFTAAASKHGMGVQEFASKVLRNKEDYSPSLVKKANFARNANKWNH